MKLLNTDHEKVCVQVVFLHSSTLLTSFLCSSIPSPLHVFACLCTSVHIYVCSHSFLHACVFTCLRPLADICVCLQLFLLVCACLHLVIMFSSIPDSFALARAPSRSCNLGASLFAYLCMYITDKYLHIC